MLPINGNTKISELIRANPASIETIASINAHFNKLRNPVLRKILAARVTIAEAARIGKVDIQTFFNRLMDIGFTVDAAEATDANDLPGNRNLQQADRIIDVRPVLADGKDPFNLIMKELGHLTEGETLLLINSFEPSPLIRILEERGYKTSSLAVSPDEVHTYISGIKKDNATAQASVQADFESIAQRFAGRLQTIDVRELPMPQPMMRILARLDELPGQSALVVQHRKMPLFLLPELAAKNFSYVSKATDGGYDILIFKEADLA